MTDFFTNILNAFKISQIVAIEQMENIPTYLRLVRKFLEGEKLNRSSLKSYKIYRNIFSRYLEI